ncbi:diversity-generating retroelement protein bAvd family protein [Terrimonas sp.]|uniref:four helix bundle protein n=1 Tax=Terrimonas sp. TaxID=1914338 RepID=UPI000D51473C|nr:four helix bundle protein [Terrimonas sp.]PVD50414.1 diversity-generating retroelement protein bAvd family protein [Terrimonas sp.]
MRDFRKLSIWSKGHQLTLKIYMLTKCFPKEETFGLVSQMRRAAYSIPSNIAEGCGRNSVPDLKRFLTISSGSASELEYQLCLSKDLNYISEPLFKELEQEIIEIKKMLFSFSSKL